MSAPQAHVHARGRGMPVVFLHGLGVDHRMFLGLDAAFDDGDAWQRLYIDLPGFGESAPLPGRGGLPDVAEWVDAVVETCVGSSPFVVVGMSMGGLLARDLARRRMGQCRGIALLAPVVDPDHERRTLPAPQVLVEDAARLASLPPDDADSYAELAVVQSQENWERFRTTVLPGLRAADLRAMAKIVGLYDVPDASVRGFESPALVIAGKQDAVVGYRDQWELAAHLPSSTYAALDRAGHNVHVDQPEAVRQLLGGWLRAVAQQEGAR